jgi:hypothetical protein
MQRHCNELLCCFLAGDGQIRLGSAMFMPDREADENSHDRVIARRVFSGEMLSCRCKLRVLSSDTSPRWSR